MLVFFSRFGCVCGVAYYCLFGFGRFRCFFFWFLCVFFYSAFAFVCFGFVLFCCVIVVGVVLGFLVFVFFACFVFVWGGGACFFVFFGGFEGQVRWPKGPPHLALNPPYFFCVIFWLSCLCF